MPPQKLYDYSQYNFDKPMFDIHEIRKVNPQRDSMEQLSGVVHVDPEKHGVVGYKDVTDNEFWCTGHMPGFPLMPGVILCESAAQLAGFYARKYKVLGGDFLGFGGMEDVRFRIPVYPNNRLILCAQMTNLRPNRMAHFQFQGFVNDQMVFTGTMIGVPITRASSIQHDPQ